MSWTLAFALPITDFDLALAMPMSLTLFEGTPTFVLCVVILLLARRLARATLTRSEKEPPRIAGPFF